MITEFIYLGMDFRGEICGVNRLKSKPFLYFYQPEIDINVRLCVE